MIERLKFANEVVIRTRSNLIVAKYRLHIILYEVWENCLTMKQKQSDQRIHSDAWFYVMEDILRWNHNKQAAIHRHMKFIHQHSLPLYSMLWMKNHDTSRFSTMKQGELCMVKWKDNVVEEEILHSEKMIRFQTWVQGYCSSNTILTRASNSALLSTSDAIASNISSTPAIDECSCSVADHTPVNSLVQITVDDVTSLLSISSSVSGCITNDDSKSEVLDHYEVTPASLSTSHNNVDDINQHDPQATTGVDQDENTCEPVNSSEDTIANLSNNTTTNHTSHHHSKLKCTSKSALKSKPQLPKSEGSSNKHSTPAPSSHDSLLDKSPYRNEQGIEKCVYCSDWFRPTDECIISACGKLAHAVHFTCWERFYHQSQRNKCPYGCHEHGAFVPVKLKWRDGARSSGIKRKLEEQDDDRCEVAVKRQHRAMNIEFNDPLAITFIEQMQSSDNESKQLFASFLREYSSQLINHTSELSCGIAKLNVKGIPAMMVATPGKKIYYLSLLCNSCYLGLLFFVLCLHFQTNNSYYWIDWVVDNFYSNVTFEWLTLIQQKMIYQYGICRMMYN
jgi:hypothetical protein